MGHALVQHVLDNGDRVAATTRKLSSLSFTNATEHNYLPIQLDITNSASIDAALNAVVKKLGRIDVVVCA